MIRNRFFACCMVLAGNLSFTVNLVGSDQPVPSAVIDIIVGYDAEETSAVIPHAQFWNGKEEDFYGVEFQNDGKLTITQLYLFNDCADIYTTHYSKEEPHTFWKSPLRYIWNSPLRYIKQKTIWREEPYSDGRRIESSEEWKQFVNAFRQRNEQNLPMRPGNSYNYTKSRFQDEGVRMLITLPKNDVVNISASNHEQEPKIAVSTWDNSTIYSFDKPSPKRKDAINKALNDKFLCKDRARRSNTATPKALNAQFIQEDRARKNNKTTRKALLAGIALTGAAAAYAGSQSK